MAWPGTREGPSLSTFKASRVGFGEGVAAPPTTPDKDCNHYWASEAVLSKFFRFACAISRPLSWEFLDFVSTAHVRGRTFSSRDVKRIFMQAARCGLSQAPPSRPEST